MSNIYIVVFQDIFFPNEFKEIIFSEKTDKKAIEKGSDMYVKFLVKEVRRKINENNILLIHTNKNFREITPKPQTRNFSIIKKRKSKINSKSDQRKITSGKI